MQRVIFGGTAAGADWKRDIARVCSLPMRWRRASSRRFGMFLGCENLGDLVFVYTSSQMCRPTPVRAYSAFIHLLCALLRLASLGSKSKLYNNMASRLGFQTVLDHWYQYRIGDASRLMVFFSLQPKIFVLSGVLEASQYSACTYFFSNYGYILM